MGSEVERLLQLRERQLRTSTASWLRAAEAALAAMPEASNSAHPAHDLWLRVEMSKVNPVEIVLSGAQRSELSGQLRNEPTSSEEPTP